MSRPRELVQIPPHLEPFVCQKQTGVNTLLFENPYLPSEQIPVELYSLVGQKDAYGRAWHEVERGIATGDDTVVQDAQKNFDKIAQSSGTPLRVKAHMATANLGLLSLRSGTTAEPTDIRTDNRNMASVINNVLAGKLRLRTSDALGLTSEMVAFCAIARIGSPELAPYVGSAREEISPDSEMNHDLYVMQRHGGSKTALQIKHKAPQALRSRPIETKKFVATLSISETVRAAAGENLRGLFRDGPVVLTAARLLARDSVDPYPTNTPEGNLLDNLSGIYASFIDARRDFMTQRPWFNAMPYSASRVYQPNVHDTLDRHVTP